VTLLILRTSRAEVCFFVLRRRLCLGQRWGELMFGWELGVCHVLGQRLRRGLCLGPSHLQETAAAAGHPLVPRCAAARVKAVGFGQARQSIQSNLGGALGVLRCSIAAQALEAIVCRKDGDGGFPLKSRQLNTHTISIFRASNLCSRARLDSIAAVMSKDTTRYFKIVLSRASKTPQ
jgi:hypothetical protein